MCAAHCFSKKLFFAGKRWLHVATEYMLRGGPSSIYCCTAQCKQTAKLFHFTLLTIVATRFPELCRNPADTLVNCITEVIRQSGENSGVPIIQRTVSEHVNESKQTQNVLINISSVRFCAVCHAVNVKLYVCGRCKTSFYCSTRCQSEGWKESHKKVCVQNDVCPF